MSTSLRHGVISGDRLRSFDDINSRASRIASGLASLGVKQGDSVSILMRNDIAFLECAYAVARLGAYAVPVNWHFKPEEITYVIKDSGSHVLISHADMLHQLRDAIPAGITTISVSTPPEIVTSYKVDPATLGTPDRAIDIESWISELPPYDGPVVPAPHNMIYTSGTTGHPKGVRRFAPTPDQQKSASVAVSSHTLLRRPQM